MIVIKEWLLQLKNILKISLLLSLIIILIFSAYNYASSPVYSQKLKGKRFDHTFSFPVVIKTTFPNARNKNLIKLFFLKSDHSKTMTVDFIDKDYDQDYNEYEKKSLTNNQYSDDIKMATFLEYHVLEAKFKDHGYLESAVPERQYEYEDSLMKTGYIYSNNYIPLGYYYKNKTKVLKNFFVIVAFGPKSLEYKYTTIEKEYVFDWQSISRLFQMFISYLVLIILLSYLIVLIKKVTKNKAFLKRFVFSLIIILLLFMFTNPTLNDFKEFVGNTTTGVKNKCRKEHNFIIFSIFKENTGGDRYLGIFKNFIQLDR